MIYLGININYKESYWNVTSIYYVQLLHLDVVSKCKNEYGRLLLDTI